MRKVQKVGNMVRFSKAIGERRREKLYKKEEGLKYSHSSDSTFTPTFFSGRFSPPCRGVHATLAPHFSGQFLSAVVSFCTDPLAVGELFRGE